MEKYHPSKDELAIINERFAKTPYKSENDLYSFPAMIIDNRMTAYFTRVHPTFLEQCTKDLINGVGFMVGHDTNKLPMARSFKGQLVSDGEDIEVFAKFFMQKDLEVNGVNTDDFMKAFLGGTTEDVSIGFSAKKFECSICGKDVRSMDCSHYPGKKYNDKGKEDENGILCFAWVKEPAGPSGEALREVSAVYKGAVPKAKQKKADEVPKFSINIEDGKSIKEAPEEAAVVMSFSFPFSDEYERGKGRGKGGPRQGDGGASKCKCPKCGHTINHVRGKPCAEIPCPKCGTKMKGVNMLDIKKFFAGEYSEEELKEIELTNEDMNTILEKVGEFKKELETALVKKEELKTASDNNKILLEQNEDLKNKMTVLQESLDVLETEAGETKDRLEKEIKEVKDLNVKVQKDLTVANGALDKYKKELIEETLGYGIKLNGNSYDKAKESELLKDKSIDDIKSISTGFLNELCAKFPIGKSTSGPQDGLPGGENVQNVPDEGFKI